MPSWNDLQAKFGGGNAGGPVGPSVLPQAKSPAPAPTTFDALKSKYQNYKAPPPKPVDSGDGFFGKISTDFSKHVQAGAEDFEKGVSGDISEPSTILQMAGEGAGFVSDLGKETIKKAGSFIPTGTTDKSGKEISLTDLIKSSMQSLGKTAPAQEIESKVAEFSKKHPEASGDLGALFNIGSIVPVGGAAEVAGDAAENVAKGAGEKVVNTMAFGVPKTKDVIESARTALSKPNVLPQVEKAADRIENPPVENAKPYSATPDSMKQGIGNSSIKDPASLHEQYYNQEQKALSDTKQDTALGMVGSDAGKAFNTVVKLRQAAGKKMSSELEKFRNVKVPTNAGISSLQKDLLDNGVKYDSVTGEVIPTSESKFSSADLNVMQKYSEELQKLGSSPTAKQLDAFIGKIPNEIKALKSTAKIDFDTNAERIVGNNLNKLRSSLKGAATPAYRDARTTYAGLSKTIDNGARLFGRITESGDFQNDASLVKSSVQSALNGGKKDFLLKLEKLTGEPIIDKATLALQAMKDAGDYRGESLLQLLSEGDTKIPTSPHSLLDKMTKGAINLGKHAVVGSKFDQTQRYLKSLSK